MSERPNNVGRTKLLQLLKKEEQTSRIFQNLFIRFAASLYSICPEHQDFNGMGDTLVKIKEAATQKMSDADYMNIYYADRKGEAVSHVCQLELAQKLCQELKLPVPKEEPDDIHHERI